MSDAHEIAQQLGETDPQPIALIGRILRRLGPAQTWALLEQVWEVERAGGMLTSDAARRRTPGGVFFALVRQHLDAMGHDRPGLLQPRRRRATPAPPPVTPGRLRPRLRARPAGPEPAAPRSAVDSNTALQLARRYLPPETGCYAVGAHAASLTLRVRFSFPDVARVAQAAALAAVAQESGWQVEVHPEAHQGHLAQAALALLPAGLAPAGGPSLRPAARTLTLRCRGDAPPDTLAAARQAFAAQTGWALLLEPPEG